MVSPVAVAHGLSGLVFGVLAAFFPKLFVAAWAQIAAAAGVKLIPLSGPILTLMGAFLIGFGTAHVHAGVASRKAAAGLICSESVVTGALVAAGYMQKQPFFFVAAAAPAFFFLWAVIEYAACSRRAHSKDE